MTISTVLGADIYNNFKDLNNPSSSVLPHVRSDIQDYLKEGENNIAKLKMDYFFSPFNDIYVRLDAGLLEEMFGGFGGEILYRPFESNFAVSFNLHKVKQRDYDQTVSYTHLTLPTILLV